MPLTTSAKWDAVRNDMAAREHAIVKVTDGTDTWLFSDIEMELTDGHVYNVLKSWGDIASGCDIFSRKWLTQNIQVRLSNHNYRKDTTADGWKRLGDDLSGIYGRDAEIYLMKGDAINALADCLKRFSGKVGAPPAYTADLVTITLVSKQKYIDKQLPATLLSDIFTSPPVDSIGKHIPLVYGQFTTNYGSYDRTGLGLARIHAINKQSTDFIVADHILHALTDIYIFDNDIKDVIQYISPTVLVDSGGRGRITDTAGLVHAWVYPIDNDDSKYSMEGVTFADIANAIDRDAATYTEALVNQALGDGSEVTPKAIYMMSLDDRLLRKYKEHPQFAYKFSTPGFALNGAYSYLTSKRRLYYYSDDKWGDLFTGENTSGLDSPSWIPFNFPLSSIIRGPDHVTVGPAVFTGTGLNDLIAGGSYVASDSVSMTYYIRIGTTGTPDTFQFHKGFAGTWGSEIAMTGSAQALMDGVSVTWASTTGHNTSQFWSIRVYVSGIIDAPVMYAGAGPDDVSRSGTFNGLPFGANGNLEVVIDGVGSPNTFKWRFGAGSYTTGVSITGGVQTLSKGVTIKFEETNNHLLNDKWDTTVYAAASGVNDVLSSGLFTGDKDTLYKLIIDGLLSLNYGGGLVDTYDIFRDGVQIYDHKACTTGSLIVDEGVSVSWQRQQQHVLNSYFEINCLSPRIPNANFMIGIYVEGTIASGPRLATDWFMRIQEARLKIRFLADGTVPHYAACNGLKYNTWIDGRSSNYASTNLIEDPVGIVESILRDLLVLTTADIVTTSFILAEDTNVKARMNLHDGNSLSAFDAIRQLSEQSTFCFSFGPDAKSRIIDLSDKSPTTTRTIPFSHIVKDSIVVGITSNIRNLLHIDSLWQEEHADFAEHTTVEDTTSTADVGIGNRQYNAKWPNIAGTSKDAVSANLVNSTDGIWSKRHTTLSLKTLGHINADLIEGDWIELDAASVDYHIKCYDASWSGKQFLVVNVKQGQKHTTFKAVNLW